MQDTAIIWRSLTSKNDIYFFIYILCLSLLKLLRSMARLLRMLNTKPDANPLSLFCVSSNKQISHAFAPFAFVSHTTIALSVHSHSASEIRLWLVQLQRQLFASALTSLCSNVLIIKLNKNLLCSPPTTTTSATFKIMSKLEYHERRLFQVGRLRIEYAHNSRLSLSSYACFCVYCQCMFISHTYISKINWLRSDQKTTHTHGTHETQQDRELTPNTTSRRVAECRFGIACRLAMKCDKIIYVCGHACACASVNDMFACVCCVCAMRARLDLQWCACMRQFIHLYGQTNEDKQKSEWPTANRIFKKKN